MSGGLRKLATLDFAVQTRRSRPGPLNLIRPPSLPSLLRAPPDIAQRLAHRPLESDEHLEALGWLLVREASPYFVQSSPLLAARAVAS